MKIDLLIQNAYVFMTYRQVFEKKDIAIVGDSVHQVADNLDVFIPHALTIINAKGKYIVPGLIDCHMHIESSMTYPAAFSEAALKYGTTTVVSDPHEMANVFGIKGILDFMNQETDLDIFYAIPSSVPSTSPEIETSGAILDVKAILPLLDHDKVICLGEVMHFGDLVSLENTEIKKIITACQNHPKKLKIEGHCPRLSSDDLAKFIRSGVDSDHTQQTPESILEKIDAGMFIELQKKSLSKDVITVIEKYNLYENIALITDDVMPDDLIKGHLNQIIAKAVQLGMPFEKAIYCATYTPARRMQLYDRGALTPGKIADFILLEDRNIEQPLNVFKSGKQYQPAQNDYKFTSDFYNTVHTRLATLSDFELHVEPSTKTVHVNVMSLSNQGTFTEKTSKMLNVKDGIIDWQSAGLSLVAVFERHGKNGNISHGLVENALLKHGAIGTTWSHDSHNLLVIGNDPESMKSVQNRLIEIQGGFCVAFENEIIAEMPLKIGGIVSNQPLKILASQMSQVRASIEMLGYENQNVIMSVATLGLVVSPELKITDKGLFNVKTQQFEPLIINEM